MFFYLLQCFFVYSFPLLICLLDCCVERGSSAVLKALFARECGVLMFLAGAGVQCGRQMRVNKGVTAALNKQTQQRRSRDNTDWILTPHSCWTVLDRAALAHR